MPWERASYWALAADPLILGFLVAEIIFSGASWQSTAFNREMLALAVIIAIVVAFVLLIPLVFL